MDMLIRVRMGGEGGCTPLGPKPPTASGADGTWAMAITSVSAPGGTASISRVDLSRSERSPGSGGSAGSMEVEES